jgi:hypothetical protein
MQVNGRTTDWSITMGWDFRLRTAATNRPIVNSTGDMLEWKAIVLMMIMPAGENSLLVHQSSLAILPAEEFGASRRNGRSENFAYQYVGYVNGFLICRKILRYGTFDFGYLVDWLLWWGETTASQNCGIGPIILSPSDSNVDLVEDTGSVLTPNLSNRALWPSPETSLERVGDGRRKWEFSLSICMGLQEFFYMP